MIALIIIPIIAFLIIACLLYKERSPTRRGERGEATVAKALGETIPGEQYIINDLLFDAQSGKSCQIDHIYINKHGIWVIETKNYAGNIYGDDARREWKQVLARGNVVNEFYNPVKQNATHIYHLSKYLKVDNIFQNVVVFLSRADISGVTSDKVYSVFDLPYIKNKHTETNLSVEKMEYYYNKLSELKSNCTITHEQHVENIHKMQADLQQGICPRCGGKLVLRNGKYNRFYGCSNYPNCKFTKNIE